MEDFIELIIEAVFEIIGLIIDAVIKSKKPL